MKYLGNQPSIEIVQSYSDKWDYIQASDPTASINPSTLYARWLNSSTGIEFICTDNSFGANIWTRQGSPNAMYSTEQTSWAIVSSWTTNITWTGLKWREGKSLCLSGYAILSGVPDDVPLTITLPDSLSIDTTASYSDLGSYGTAGFRDNNIAAKFFGLCVTSSGTSFNIRPLYDSASYEIEHHNMSATIPFTWAVDDKIHFKARIPIIGWANNGSDV